MKLIRMLTALLFLLSGHLAFAANHYIRSDATGTGSGNDWTNASTTLPNSLIRGDTYYVADGSYPAYTFDDAESGTLVITIKKATAADHGTETGWQTTFGDGQAVFKSTLTFGRSYYVFDGQTRNESNWFDGASYGFRVYHNNQDQNIIVQGPWPKAANYVTIKNVFVDAIVGNLPNTTIRRFAVDTDTYGGDIGVGQVFSKMYVRGANNVWMLRSTEGVLLEYSASEDVDGNSANHGEIVNLYYSANNAIVRYNQFRNAYLNGGATALVAITYSNGLQFYGNLAYNFSVGDAAIGFNGYDSSHNRVYNNTFIKGIGYNSGMRWGSGTDNLVYNNIFIACNTVAIEGTHDYNVFSDSNARGEAHAQVNVPTSIFTNYAGNDFTLKVATSAGLSLVSPFNSDIKGFARGADGIWDRGAFEFSATGATPAPTPTATPVPPASTATPTPAPTATPLPPAAISGETLLGSSSPAIVDANDGVSYELGMKFSATTAGQITAIRFYKSPSETSSHTGKIYSSTGALLASVAFANETASGWQIANLASPLSIAANITYTVSVNTGAGFYVATNNAFSVAKSSTNLRAPVSAGVYGAVGAMPTTTWSASNYFRDVVFTASSTPAPTPTSDTTAPSVAITSPASGTMVARSSVVTITASANDNVAVTKVEFYVNNSLKCTDTAAPFTCAWTVGKWAKNFGLTAKAYDAAGNVGTSANVVVSAP